ncbi:hypothetical protein D3C84_985500 [compost metagenome]
MELPVADNFLQRMLQIRNPVSNMAAVRLQLRLAGTARTDAAAEAGQIFAMTG